MSASYRVTPRAFADLAAIARYTVAVWDESQRDAYLEAIEQRFSWLAKQPMAGRSRPEINERYRSFPEGSHVIFYIVREDGIDIIGVPHRSMGLPTYFSKDD